MSSSASVSLVELQFYLPAAESTAPTQDVLIYLALVLITAIAMFLVVNRHVVPRVEAAMS